MKTFAVMPSNIALIKYMGKTDGNLPLNPSLSYTTPKFESYVGIEEGGQGDSWQALSEASVRELYDKKVFSHDHLLRDPLVLNSKEIEKFLLFFKALKALYKVEGHFVIRSYNAFPSSCGLASSASSFAALTMAAHRLFSGPEKSEELEKLSRLSQKGSGSSCRSFFSPWALWKDKGASQADINLELDHYVVVVADQRKAISSSEAHLRVLTSLNFEGRSARAQKRLEKLTVELEENWNEAYQTCWSEFWDMHSLFETSNPPFGYLKRESLAVLDLLRRFWEREGRGPLVTMDAGPNIHLLFQKEDEDLQTSCLSLLSQYRVL